MFSSSTFDINKYKESYKEFMKLVDLELEGGKLHGITALAELQQDVIKMFGMCYQLNMPAPDFVTQTHLMKIHQAYPVIFSAFTHNPVFMQRLHGYVDGKQSEKSKKKWDKFFSKLRSFDSMQVVPTIYFDVAEYHARSQLPITVRIFKSKYTMIKDYVENKSDENDSVINHKEKFSEFISDFGSAFNKKLSSFEECAKKAALFEEKYSLSRKAYKRAEKELESIKKKYNVRFSNVFSQEESIRKSDALISFYKTDCENLNNEISLLDQSYAAYLASWNNLKDESSSSSSEGTSDSDMNDLQLLEEIHGISTETRSVRYKKALKKFEKKQKVIDIENKLTQIQEQKDRLAEELRMANISLNQEKSNAESFKNKLLELEGILQSSTAFEPYLSAKANLRLAKENLDRITSQRNSAKSELDKSCENLAALMENMSKALDNITQDNELTLLPKRRMRPNKNMHQYITAINVLKEFKDSFDDLRKELRPKYIMLEFQKRYAEFMNHIDAALETNLNDEFVRQRDKAQALVPHLSDLLTRLYALKLKLPKDVLQTDLMKIYHVLPDAFTEFSINPKFRKRLVAHRSNVPAKEHWKLFRNNLNKQVLSNIKHKSKSKLLTEVKAMMLELDELNKLADRLGTDNDIKLSIKQFREDFQDKLQLYKTAHHKFYEDKRSLESNKFMTQAEINIKIDLARETLHYAGKELRNCLNVWVNEFDKAAKKTKDKSTRSYRPTFFNVKLIESPEMRQAKRLKQAVLRVIEQLGTQQHMKKEIAYKHL